MHILILTFANCMRNSLTNVRIKIQSYVLFIREVTHVSFVLDTFILAPSLNNHGWTDFVKTNII